MKSILEYLQELPDGYREKAIKNHELYPFNHTKVTSLNQALCFGFDWSATSEGYEFWLECSVAALGACYPTLPED